jgi:hypothetical protein
MRLFAFRQDHHLEEVGGANLGMVLGALPERGDEAFGRRLCRRADQHLAVRRHGHLGGPGLSSPETIEESHVSGVPGRASHNRAMADGTNRMVFLGFGKYARADKIYALEPLTGDERGGGRRTRVWIEGVPDPIIAGRTERTILHEMGQEAAANTQIIDQSIELAERIAAGAESGRVDLADLGRRARRLLESTAKPQNEDQLF